MPRPEPKAIPIMPRSGLYLAGYGHGDDARFARLFRETWKRFPLRDRRRMLGYWREPSDERAIRQNLGVLQSDWNNPDLRAASDDPARWMEWRRPVIELVSGWRKSQASRGIVSSRRHCGAQGMVYAMGHAMFFHAPTVGAMTDGEAQDLIAHELCHVLQSCEVWKDRDGKPLDGKPPRHGRDMFGGDIQSEEDCELDVFERMEERGFDPFSGTGMILAERRKDKTAARKMAGLR